MEHTAGEVSGIRIGISSCLLGERVRYDGGHKADSYIMGTLGRHFEFVPHCPEMAIGMGTPRPPIRLVGEPMQPYAIGVRDASLDVTEKLLTHSRDKASELTHISGYILKSKSPSCGMARVKVYREAGVPPRMGTGLFARELMAVQPLLPVEEDGRLGNPVLRENFLGRVFAYHRWQQFLAAGPGADKLVTFHACHKLILMAHGQEHYRRLGRLVADAGKRRIDELVDEYGREFMAALKHHATPRRHTNVLMHLMGYLKKTLDKSDKSELLTLFEEYRLGRIPLLVPLTLLKHHFRRHPHPYISQQYYLEPFPLELMF